MRTRNDGRRGRSRTREWAIAATSEVNMDNELSDMMSEEAVKTIISAMNNLPDDVMSYVMAYTEVKARFSHVVILILEHDQARPYAHLWELRLTAL